MTVDDVDWLGKFGEDIWRWVLECSGWYYIPLANIDDGGAPMMRGNGESTILPDADICRHDRNLYVEAKAKSQSIFFRKKGKERHGINERNYRHYRRISDIRKQRCAIAVVEIQSEYEAFRLRWSGSLLIATLKDLGEPSSEHPENPPKVYWNCKDFNYIATDLTAMELFELAGRRRRRDFSDDLDRALIPWTQGELF